MTLALWEIIDTMYLSIKSFFWIPFGIMFPGPVFKKPEKELILLANLNLKASLAVLWHVTELLHSLL